MSTENVVQKHCSQKSLSLQFALQIGCSALLRGTSQIHPNFSARVIPKTKLAEFLATEGRVYFILKSAPHPNLPRLLSCVDSVPIDQSNKEGSAMLFPEYFSDLHSVIRSQEKLSEAIARSYFLPLMTAIAHCHARQIVLGDIRLGKIMFTDRSLKQIVFADLSGARHLPSLGRAMDCKGMSPAYVAPEVLTSQFFEHPNPVALDMWAMGVVLYVMLVGAFPFSSMDPSVLCEKICAAQVVFPAWVKPGARRLISRMLSRDPASRPAAKDVLDDPWLLGAQPAVKRPAEEPPVEAGPDDQVVPDLPANAAKAQRS